MRCRAPSAGENSLCLTDTFVSGVVSMEANTNSAKNTCSGVQRERCVLFTTHDMTLRSKYEEFDAIMTAALSYCKSPVKHTSQCTVFTVVLVFRTASCCLYLWCSCV